MKTTTAKILYLALCVVVVLLLPLICSQPATEADTDSWCIMEFCLLVAFALCGWLLGRRIPDAGEEKNKSGNNRNLRDMEAIADKVYNLPEEDHTDDSEKIITEILNHVK